MLKLRGKKKDSTESTAKRPKPAKAERARHPSRMSRRGNAADAATAEPVVLAGYRRPPVASRKSLVLYLALTVVCLGWGYMFGASAPYRIVPLLAPLPLLALLVIWTLPQGEYAPTKAMEPLFLAFFVSLVIWPNYLAVSIPPLPWLTLLRIFGVPLALVLFISVSVSANFRGTLRRTLTTDPYLWKLVVGFVAIQTLSLLFTGRPSQSINKYLVAQLNQTVIFVVSCYLFTRPTFATRWTIAYLVMAYIVCSVGIWQQVLGQLPWAGHIPPLLKIDSPLVDRVLVGIVRASVGVNRVQSVAGSPLSMAELLGLAAPFGLHFAMSRGPLVTRLLGLLYLPLAAYVIVLSDSRLGLVILMGTMLFYVLIWSALRWTSDSRSLMGPALVLAYPAVLASTLIASFAVGSLRRAVWGSGAEASSNASRVTQWAMAKPKILAQPWGYGIGEASREVGFRGPTGVGTLDSYYIALLMDYGILGFAIYMAMFARASWVAGSVVVRKRPTGEALLLLPLSVAILNFIVVKLVLALEANHPLMFMMLGAVIGLAWRVNQQDKAAPKPQPPVTFSMSPR